MSGSGSIPLTNGSGSESGRLKNMWIRWIRTRGSDPDPPHCGIVTKYQTHNYYLVLGSERTPCISYHRNAEVPKGLLIELLSYYKFNFHVSYLSVVLAVA
jgi:hypothetical protein